MRTKFTELVGCDLPIQQAAFGSHKLDAETAERSLLDRKVTTDKFGELRAHPNSVDRYRGR